MYYQLLHQLVVQVDIFFYQVNLRFNKMNAHRTRIGVLASLSVLAVFLFSVYFFGRDIVERKQPETSFVQQYEPNPQQVLHNPDTMPFAFTLIDYSTWESFADETLYQVTYELQEQFITIDQNGKRNFAVKRNTYKAVICDLDRDVKYSGVKDQFA